MKNASFICVYLKECVRVENVIRRYSKRNQKRRSLCDLNIYDNPHCQIVIDISIEMLTCFPLKYLWYFPARNLSTIEI